MGFKFSQSNSKTPSRSYAYMNKMGIHNNHASAHIFTLILLYQNKVCVECHHTALRSLIGLISICSLMTS